MRGGAGHDGARIASLRAALAGRRPEEVFDLPGFVRAAVLVPLLDGPAGWELLFTVRSSRLAHHPGEISFPGGRLEPGETVVDAALRETHEEVGLRVDSDAVLGSLASHPTPAGYVATPVVAHVPWPQEVAPDPLEVDEVFTVPVAELLDVVPTARESTLAAYTRLIHSYSWHDRVIWGFTGNVLKDLLDLVAGSVPTGRSR